ncbi:hypothetical protein LTR29_017634 [Friedmanniomyces endolithicus]|nr:hypothetical protein LTS09_017919 [Friedmanniomyces endolithicus]KAK0927446.1 hypothetical protein LTR29_017634 [Friedmanniomyces endolithicus]
MGREGAGNGAGGNVVGILFDILNSDDIHYIKHGVTSLTNITLHIGDCPVSYSSMRE